MQGGEDTHCGRFVESTDVSAGELSPYDSFHVDFMKRSSSSGVMPRSAKTCSCGIGLLCFSHSLASLKAFSSLGSRGSSSVGALAIARETGSSILSSNPTTAEACLGASLSINSCARRFSLSPFPAIKTFYVSANTGTSGILHDTEESRRSIAHHADSRISPGLIFPVARFAINSRFAAKKSYSPNSFGSTQAIRSKQSGAASPSAIAAA